MSLDVLREQHRPLLAPISPDAPAGEDARYDPTHEAVRNEVGKLESPSGGEVAWDTVVSDGRTILEGKAKDFLITSYVACAWYELEGIDGLSKGLALLSMMMEEHWDGMFPPKKRIRARANAARWLLERVNFTLGETAVDGTDHARVGLLEESAKAFAGVVGDKFGDAAPAVRPLLESVERLRLSLPEPVAAPADPAAAPQSADASVAPAPEPGGPPSEATPDAGAAAPAGEAASPPAEPPSAASPPVDNALVDNAPVNNAPVDHEALLTEAVAAWLAPIPGDSPAGIDARYEPQHEALRGTISALESPTGGEVDWFEVVKDAGALLAEQSKDLLIASYLAYGLYETEGLGGLATGLTLLRELQDQYWEDLQPPKKRMRGRTNALGWLMDRLEPRVAETPLTADDGPVLSRLEFAAKRFASVTRDKFEDAAPALRPLQENIQRLTLSLPKPESKPEKKPEPAPAPKTSASPPASTSPTPKATVALDAPAAALADAADISKFLLEVGTSLTKAGSKVRAASASDPNGYRLPRIGLYLHIQSAPPAQGQKTTIPGPPEPFRNQLETLLSNQKWEALLEEAESALGQYRFSLDLQRYVAVALAGLGDAYAPARDAVVQGVGALLRRMPELVDREFADGTPFCGAAARTWIGSEVLTGGGGGGAAPTEGPASEALEEAKKLAAGGKGAEAIALLQKAIEGTANTRAQFVARIELAEAAVAIGNAGMARAMYAGLLVDVDARGLLDWEPTLCAKLLTGYLGCLKSLEKTDKSVTGEAAIVYRHLSRVDPQAALKAGA
ncbi:MAG: type VI secretion system protein TssA [Myxococcota bacterium]